ncbi:hypothetical protein ACLOJK_032137 [Asimina triloba]
MANRFPSLCGNGIASLVIRAIAPPGKAIPLLNLPSSESGESCNLEFCFATVIVEMFPPCKQNLADFPSRTARFYLPLLNLPSSQADSHQWYPSSQASDLAHIKEDVLHSSHPWRKHQLGQPAERIGNRGADGAISSSVEGGGLSSFDMNSLLNYWFAEENLLPKTERFRKQSVFRSIRDCSETLNPRRCGDSVAARAAAADPTSSSTLFGATNQIWRKGIGTGLRRKRPTRSSAMLLLSPQLAALQVADVRHDSTDLNVNVGISPMVLSKNRPDLEERLQPIVVSGTQDITMGRLQLGEISSTVDVVLLFHPNTFHLALPTEPIYRLGLLTFAGDGNERVRDPGKKMVLFDQGQPLQVSDPGGKVGLLDAVWSRRLWYPGGVRVNLSNQPPVPTSRVGLPESDDTWVGRTYSSFDSSFRPSTWKTRLHLSPAETIEEGTVRIVRGEWVSG